MNKVKKVGIRVLITSLILNMFLVFAPKLALATPLDDFNAKNADCQKEIPSLITTAITLNCANDELLLANKNVVIGKNGELTINGGLRVATNGVLSLIYNGKLKVNGYILIADGGVVQNNNANLISAFQKPYYNNNSTLIQISRGAPSLNSAGTLDVAQGGAFVDGYASNIGKNNKGVVIAEYVHFYRANRPLCKNLPLPLTGAECSDYDIVPNSGVVKHFAPEVQYDFDNNAIKIFSSTAHYQSFDFLGAQSCDTGSLVPDSKHYKNGGVFYDEENANRVYSEIALDDYESPKYKNCSLYGKSGFFVQKAEEPDVYTQDSDAVYLSIPKKAVLSSAIKIVNHTLVGLDKTKTYDIKGFENEVHFTRDIVVQGLSGRTSYELPNEITSVEIVQRHTPADNEFSPDAKMIYAS
jgi:hypothetical protein